ncbi:MAG: hypothetical protein IKU71_08280 [Kiritimatiellae bacterium]|nr:hypothetical protein [Kiritimatiellia bacterium]
MKKILPTIIAALALAGCASYRWTSPVPADMRTVNVPTFRNESDLLEFGAVATRQVLREFQREGTFKIASADDAAIEVQGVIKSVSTGRIYFKREMSMRAYEQRLIVSADVSFVDRRNGKVIVNNRRYTAETTYFSDTDMATARRDASGRAAEDLARQIVDDVTSCRWDNAKGKEAAK